MGYNYSSIPLFQWRLSKPLLKLGNWWVIASHISLWMWLLILTTTRLPLNHHSGESCLCAVTVMWRCRKHLSQRVCSFRLKAAPPFDEILRLLSAMRLLQGYLLEWNHCILQCLTDDHLSWICLWFAQRKYVIFYHVMQCCVMIRYLISHHITSRYVTSHDILYHEIYQIKAFETMTTHFADS